MTQNCPGKFYCPGLFAEQDAHVCPARGKSTREWFQAIWLPQGTGVRVSTNNVQLHWCWVFDEKDHLQLLAAPDFILALEKSMGAVLLTCISGRMHFSQGQKAVPRIRQHCPLYTISPFPWGACLVLKHTLCEKPFLIPNLNLS